VQRKWGGDRRVDLLEGHEDDGLAVGTGEESQDDVERRVDELLDQMLPETDEDDEEDEWD